LHFFDIELAYPDTNEGKSISKFCKQFKPHLTASLKKNRLLSSQASQRLHILFIDSHTAYIGVSQRENSAPQAMGITRLKMPADAPSRSTLKLEEALHWFIDQEQQRQFIKAGMQAVDLGAAPGGWSWQLVQRGMLVTAIDNGPMQAELMSSGMVEHLQTDAFKWMPDKPVDWLVCDMVERPLHVSRMVTRWFTRRRCQYSIFNLKLPMNKRFAMVLECLTYIHNTLNEANIQHQLAAKQLYHDREEITVFLRRLQPGELAQADT
jgi:23S rRNA (cytidine2498-2'-O)-methyltransferase